VTPASGIQEFPGPLSRSFISDVNAPSAARGALEDLNGHVEERLLERARIVVTELVTNSVRHGRLSPAQRIALRVWAQRQLLRLEVIDDGNGFDPAETRTGLEHYPGGWGLMIVAQLTDRWGVDLSRRTRVWCEFEPWAARGPAAPVEPRRQKTKVGTPSWN
jgi:anti-sigma regulatory factor (Ser/Thr protein kinase)